MSFWGIVLEPKRTYIQREVEHAFHISAASLDIQNCDPTEDAVSVVCSKQDSNSFILCNLSKKHKILNVPLNLDFELGSEISFSVTGNSTVHLTGFLIEDVESFGSDDSMEEDEEEENDLEEALVQETKKMLDKSAKRKQESKQENKSKKAKVEANVQANEDDDDDEDDSDFDIDSSGDDDDDDDDDVEEEEDEDDDEDDDDDDDDDDDQEAELPKKIEVAKKDGSKKLKPTNQQAAKGSPKESQKVDQNTKQGKKDSKTSSANKLVNGAQPQANGISKRTVKGGVIVEDLTVGSGQVAKEGSMVSVYYVGRLKQNNKQFDASQSGSGFKFRLGRGEVIKGWDVGVTGMKVGGKRRLTIPPKMAYGQQGSEPVIPPNSTLVFEVELKNVK